MNMAKKVLAVLLCVALCAMMPVSLAISAEDTTEQATARAELVAAWQALEKSVTEEVAMVPETLTDADGNTVTRQPATDTAKYGTYWYENIHIFNPTDEKKVPGYGSRIVFALTNSPADLTKYNTLTYRMEAFCDGSVAKVKTDTQVNWGNNSYCDWTTAIPVNKVTGATSISFDIMEGGPVSHINLGSVLGTYTEKPALPENYDTISFGELVLAAKKVDLSGYEADMVSAFESALLTALPLAEEELLSLLRTELETAWQGLTREEATTLITPRDKDIAELPESLGLTAEQKGKFGPNFGYLNANQTQYFHYSAPYKDKSLAGFDRIEYSYFVPSGTAQVRISVEKKGGETGWAYLGAYNQSCSTGFGTVIVQTSGNNIDALLNGTAQINGVKYERVSGDVYIGSVLGYKTVSASLPEGHETFSNAQLIQAAEEMDLTGYDADSVAAFETALQMFKEQAGSLLKQALLDAWAGLKIETSTPLLGAGSATTELPESLGLTLEQKALMGPYCAEISSAKNSYYHWDKALSPYKDNSLAGFDKLTYSYYSPEGSVVVRVAAECHSGKWAYFSGWTQSCKSGFNTVTVSPTGNNMEGLLDGSEKINATKYEYVSGDGTAYIGSLLGWTVTAATLPEGAMSMSAEELLAAAKALNMADYTEGTEAFTAAVNALDAALNTTVTTEEVTGGALAVDNAMAQAGETVTVTVTPDEGYQLKAGSLKVLDGNGSALAVPERVGFRETADSSAFVFPMVGDKVTVTAEFVKLAETTVPNMGLVGRSVNREKQGLRNVYRMYLTEEDGTYYTVLNGTKTAVDCFGVLLCTEKTYNKLTAMDLNAIGTAGLVNTEFSALGTRYDVCDEYLDISVQVIGLDTETRQNTPIYTRAYVKVGDQVFYTDATAQTYAYYAN